MRIWKWLKKKAIKKEIDTKNEKYLFGKIVQEAIDNRKITLNDAEKMGYRTVTDVQNSKERAKNIAKKAVSIGAISAGIGFALLGPFGAVTLGAVGAVTGGFMGMFDDVKQPRRVDSTLDLNYLF